MKVILVDIEKKEVEKLVIEDVLAHLDSENQGRDVRYLALRYVGVFNGVEFWEGDVVETSDGKLTKTIEWVDKDFGFGNMWFLARYAEKQNCGLKRISNVYYDIKKGE